jgi:hypothetical protein
VAGVEISEELRQQIGPTVAVPQMMMRIDDPRHYLPENHAPTAAR